eukprot:PhM_4_TR15192/c0_g1_i1/m.97367
MSCDRALIEQDTILGVDYVAECKKRGCKINTAVLQSLSQNVDAALLTTIDLNNNFVGAKGLSALLVVLSRHCRATLKRICVADNYLANESVIELCDAMTGAAALQHIDIRDNSVSHVAGKKVSSFISRHETVTEVLVDNTLINPALMKIIQSKCLANAAKSGAQVGTFSASVAAPPPSEEPRQKNADDKIEEEQPTVAAASGEEEEDMDVKNLASTTTAPTMTATTDTTTPATATAAATESPMDNNNNNDTASVSSDGSFRDYSRDYPCVTLLIKATRSHPHPAKLHSLRILAMVSNTTEHMMASPENPAPPPPGATFAALLGSLADEDRTPHLAALARAASEAAATHDRDCERKRRALEEDDETIIPAQVAAERITSPRIVASEQQHLVADPSSMPLRTEVKLHCAHRHRSHMDVPTDASTLPNLTMLMQCAATVGNIPVLRALWDDVDKSGGCVPVVPLPDSRETELVPELANLVASTFSSLMAFPHLELIWQASSHMVPDRAFQPGQQGWAERDAELRMQESGVHNRERYNSIWKLYEQLPTDAEERKVTTDTVPRRRSLKAPAPRKGLSPASRGDGKSSNPPTPSSGASNNTQPPTGVYVAYGNFDALMQCVDDAAAVPHLRAMWDMQREERCKNTPAGAARCSVPPVAVEGVKETSANALSATTPLLAALLGAANNDTPASLPSLSKVLNAATTTTVSPRSEVEQMRGLQVLMDAMASPRDPSEPSARRGDIGTEEERMGALREVLMGGTSMAGIAALVQGAQEGGQSVSALDAVLRGACV